MEFGWLKVICYHWYLNWFKNKTSLTLKANLEAYSEPCQTSKMEISAKIVNSFLFFTSFAKSSILDVEQDSEFVSEASNDLHKKLFLSCLTGFWIYLSINYFRKNYFLFVYKIWLNSRDLMFNIFAQSRKL